LQLPHGKHHNGSFYLFFFIFPFFHYNNEISTRGQLQFQDRLVVESRSKYDLSWTSNLQLVLWISSDEQTAIRHDYDEACGFYIEVAVGRRRTGYGLSIRGCDDCLDICFTRDVKPVAITSCMKPYCGITICAVWKKNGIQYSRWISPLRKGTQTIVIEMLLFKRFIDPLSLAHSWSYRKRQYRRLFAPRSWDYSDLLCFALLAFSFFSLNLYAQYSSTYLSARDSLKQHISTVPAASLSSQKKLNWCLNANRLSSTSVSLLRDSFSPSLLFATAGATEKKKSYFKVAFSLWCFSVFVFGFVFE